MQEKRTSPVFKLSTCRPCDLAVPRPPMIIRPGKGSGRFQNFAVPTPRCNAIHSCAHRYKPTNTNATLNRCIAGRVQAHGFLLGADNGRDQAIARGQHSSTPGTRPTTAPPHDDTCPARAHGSRVGTWLDLLTHRGTSQVRLPVHRASLLGAMPVSAAAAHSRLSTHIRPRSGTPTWRSAAKYHNPAATVVATGVLARPFGVEHVVKESGARHQGLLQPQPRV